MPRSLLPLAVCAPADRCDRTQIVRCGPPACSRTASRESHPSPRTAPRPAETRASPEYPDNSNGSARKSTDPSSRAAPESLLPPRSPARRPLPTSSARRAAPGPPRAAGCACGPPQSTKESESLRKLSAYKRHTKIQSRCAPHAAPNSKRVVQLRAPPAARSAPTEPLVSAPVFLPGKAAASRCAAISRWKFSEWTAAAAAQPHQEACPSPHSPQAQFHSRSVSLRPYRATPPPPPAVPCLYVHPARRTPPRIRSALPPRVRRFLPPHADKDSAPP